MNIKEKMGKKCECIIRRVCRITANTAIELLYPRRCPVCDEIVRNYGILSVLSEERQKICPKCMRKLRLLTPPWCMKCGKKLTEEKEFCSDCNRIAHHFERGRALYEYQSVARSVYRLKYGGRQEYAEYYGEEMARYLKSFLCQIRPDGIVPIPIHRKRMKKRGYNQAALLARALGRCTGIAVYDKFLVRIKNTTPLKLQNPAERQNNLKKAFIIGENDVKLKTILLVDDIYTTGSTMDEAARVLKAHGAEKIYFVTLACGEGV